MSAPTLQSVSRPEARLAAARSRAYETFARLFDYPDAELVEDVRDGTLADAVRAVLTEVDPELAARGSWDALRDAGSEPDDLAVEYTRLFDVGASGPPCPLYGGLYGGARMKTMEEAVRFYNHFELSMAEGAPSATSSRGTPGAGSPDCGLAWRKTTRCRFSAIWSSGSRTSWSTIACT
jgi:hypothetical protein